MPEFGHPVTEAGGKLASSRSADVVVGGICACTVDTRCHTPGAGRTRKRSVTATVPVTASRPRSLRTRSTIITFSATSLAETRRAAGSALIGRVPLMGLEVTVVPWRAR